LRAMMREDAQGRPLLRRRLNLPDGRDDNLAYQIAAALAMGPVSAGNLAKQAWALGTRLPGIGRLLADGTLTKPKAKLIMQTFEPLNEGLAARARRRPRHRRATPRRRRAPPGPGHHLPRGIRRRRPVRPRPARRPGA